jgi:hypothetical protein
VATGSTNKIKAVWTKFKSYAADKHETIVQGVKSVAAATVSAKLSASGKMSGGGASSGGNYELVSAHEHDLEVTSHEEVFSELGQDNVV